MGIGLIFDLFAQIFYWALAVLFILICIIWLWTVIPRLNTIFSIKPKRPIEEHMSIKIYNLEAQIKELKRDADLFEEMWTDKQKELEESNSVNNILRIDIINLKNANKALRDDMNKLITSSNINKEKENG